MFRTHEFEDVGVVAGEHGHLRASSTSLKRQAGAGRIVPVNGWADRGRGTIGHGVCRRWRQRRKVIADSAAHGECLAGFIQTRLEGQAGCADAYRLHKTVDHGRVDVPAGVGHNAAGADRAQRHVPQKGLRDGGALLCRLGLGQGASDPPVDLPRRDLVRPGITVGHHSRTDFLRKAHRSPWGLRAAFGGAHQQHRYGGAAHDALGAASQHQAARSPASMRADDDQVRLPRQGFVQHPLFNGPVEVFI
ncbi:hypothetical protein D9M68_639170 [compost metagenome]